MNHRRKLAARVPIIVLHRQIKRFGASPACCSARIRDSGILLAHAKSIPSRRLTGPWKSEHRGSYLAGRWFGDWASTTCNPAVRARFFTGRQSVWTKTRMPRSIDRSPA